MERRAKVWIPKDGDMTPMRYEKKYRRETVQGVERLVISTDSDWSGLLLEVVRPDSGPVMCLYESGEPGEGTRHQSGEMEYEEARRLVSSHSDLLEQWPWHNFWMFSAEPPRQVVLDEHNLLFVYGELDSVVEKLTSQGFSRGSFDVPTPHLHRPYPEFEAEEALFITELTRDAQDSVGE